MRKSRPVVKVVVTGVFACLCSALMLTGILATSQHNINISSTVKFVSSGVQGTIKGYTQGAQINHYYNSNSTATSVENTIDGTSSDGSAIEFNESTQLNQGWNIGGLQFKSSETPDAISLSFELTSTSSTEMGVLLTGLSNFKNTEDNNVEVYYTVTGAETSSYNVETLTQVPTTQIFFDVGETTATLTLSLRVISTEKDVSLNDVNLRLDIKEKSEFFKPITLYGENSEQIVSQAVIGSFVKDIPCPTSFTVPAGKEFAGWALSQGGEVVLSSTTLDSLTTLYAVWRDLT